MFVLIAKFRAAKGKEEELVQMLRQEILKVRQNEKDALIFDLHRKIDDSAEMLLYERYKDRDAFAVTHMSMPYVKEVIEALPNYLDGDLEVIEYDLVEVD